jgi:hypothetical protein
MMGTNARAGQQPNTRSTGLFGCSACGHALRTGNCESFHDVSRIVRLFGLRDHITTPHPTAAPVALLLSFSNLTEQPNNMKETAAPQGDGVFGPSVRSPFSAEQMALARAFGTGHGSLASTPGDPVRPATGARLFRSDERRNYRGSALPSRRQKYCRPQQHHQRPN